MRRFKQVAVVFGATLAVQALAEPAKKIDLFDPIAIRAAALSSL